MRGDNISSKAKKGLFWGVGNQLTRQVFSVLTTIILVRLLTPSDIGLMALVLIFSDLSNILINLGFSTAIVQDDHIDHQGIHSIFWINSITGLLIMGLLLLLAPSLALFFEEPLLHPLFMSISFVYFLFSLELVPKALLEKKLDYRSIAIAETSSTLLSSILAITLAIWGYGVWALVWQLLINNFLNVVLLWRFSRWHPRLTFTWKHIQRTSQFSGSIFYSHILQMITRSLDRFLIGKYLSKSTLGLYDKSESLSSLPRRNASGILLSVVFAAFTKIKQQPKNIKKHYLQIMKYIVLINYPLMIGLFVTTKSFVYVLFGQQWMEMVPFLRIFTIAMLFSSFNSLLGSLFLARGMSKMIIRDTSFREITIISGILIGFLWGAIGVIYGIATAQFFNFILTLHHGREVAFVSIKNQLVNIKPFVLASSTMGCVLYLFKIFTEKILPPQLLLLSNITLGAFIYLAILRLQNDQTMKQLTNFIKKKK